MTSSNENLSGDLSEREQRPSSTLLKTWYRLTAPSEPPQGASFAQRETARRGRLTSIVLLALMTTLLILLPIGLFGTNPITILAIGGGLLVSLLALLFNRFGRPNIAGLLITSYVFTAVVIVILSSPGGLSTTSLGLFYTLVFVEVLAVSLLPINWVVLAAVVNIAFVIIDLSLQPKAPELAHLAPADFYTIIIRIVSLHVFVVLVLWLWVRSATLAIKRADRAEEWATWERQMQELQQAELQQKEELEKGIESILQTYVQVSNGDFQVRAPLSQDNLLWRVAYSINNLIGRLQKYSQAEAELTYIRDVTARLTDELRDARRARRPVQISTTKTFLDPFLQELAQLPLKQSDFQVQVSPKEKESSGSFNRNLHDSNDQDT
jgi:hypothetical protein